MASGDYRSCDVCGCKTFYDAKLNYSYSEDKDENSEFRPIRGKHVQLERTGDWKVICHNCAETHEVVIVKISQAARGEK